MATAFGKFAKTYQEFVEKYPAHPIAEEIRHAISRNRFPEDRWLAYQTRRMAEILAPAWKNS